VYGHIEKTAMETVRTGERVKTMGRYAATVVFAEVIAIAIASCQLVGTVAAE
jgi:hypothetical protein